MRVFKKIKKITQWGRLIFFKGAIQISGVEDLPDSKSADYYLFILAESRREFCNLSQELSSKSLLKTPWICLKLFAKYVVRYAHLKAANQIAMSYALETKILEEAYGSGKNRCSKA